MKFKCELMCDYWKIFELNNSAILFVYCAILVCDSQSNRWPSFFGLDYFLCCIMVAALCLVCLDYTTCRRCGWCRKSGPWYCSRSCQAWHWSSAHSAECGMKAFKDGILQRYSQVPREVVRVIMAFIAADCR